MTAEPTNAWLSCSAASLPALFANAAASVAHPYRRVAWEVCEAAHPDLLAPEAGGNAAQPWLPADSTLACLDALVQVRWLAACKVAAAALRAPWCASRVQGCCSQHAWPSSHTPLLLPVCACLCKVASSWLAAGVPAAADWCHTALRRQLGPASTLSQLPGLGREQRLRLQRLEWGMLQGGLSMAARQGQQVRQA